MSNDASGSSPAQIVLQLTDTAAKYRMIFETAQATINAAAKADTVDAKIGKLKTLMAVLDWMIQTPTALKTTLYMCGAGLSGFRLLRLDEPWFGVATYAYYEHEMILPVSEELAYGILPSTSGG